MFVVELYLLEFLVLVWDIGDWVWVVIIKFFLFLRGGFFFCDWLVVIICFDGDIWFLICCFGSGIVDCCDVCVCCVVEIWFVIWRWGDKVFCKGGDVMGGVWGEEFWDCLSVLNFWCIVVIVVVCVCVVVVVIEGIWGILRFLFSWGNVIERVNKNI